MSNGVREARGPSHTPEMKSPPVQVMAGYDPNRIPSSVFSASPGDWSGASNESLFSIQMGNNSFSKDYAILYGKPPELDWNQPQSNPFKSGELPRLDDWSNRSTEFGALPPVMEEESSWQSGELSRNQSPRPAAVAVAAAKPDPTLRVSDVSNMSFAFPVLVTDSGKTDYSVRAAPEKPVSGPQKVAEKPPEVELIVPPQPQTKPQPQPQPQAKVAAHPPKRWFSCFSCSWPRFC